jgi:hypothetical protein
MRGSRIAVPLLKAEDVIPHLGSASHWKEGRSAKSLADSWFDADGIPKPVEVLLATSPGLRGAQLIDGWLERKTDLQDGCGAPSQTDLLALLSTGDELVVLAVEGKVDESFDRLVSEWLADDSSNKHKRLRRLCNRLGIGEDRSASLRYQLLHRTVAALLEAERFHATKAVFAVQSFCPSATGFDDFAKFASALGFGTVERGRLCGPRRFGTVDLWIGWVSDSHWDDFLSRPGNPHFPDCDE